MTSVFVDKSQFESYNSAIRNAQEVVEQCMVLVNRHGESGHCGLRTHLKPTRLASISCDKANPAYLDQIENQDRLEDLLKHMSDPIARMDNALKGIRDNLEGKYRNAV